MERRKIKVMCVQETKWKGKSTKVLGNGYKLYYCGENRRRNGIGIIVEESLINNVIKVNRINDRLMCIKIALCKNIINIVSAYAPQQSSQEE